MKFYTKFMIAFILLTLLAVPIFSQDVNVIGKKPPIRVVHVAGSGIVVSAEEPMLFYKAKIIGAAINIKGKPRRLGLLSLDNKRFVLKEISASMESFDANVYDKNGLMGQISLARYEKPGKDVWAGKLVLEEKGYYVYIVANSRTFTALERVHNIVDFCTKTSAEKLPECKWVEKCKENPHSETCERLIERFCLKHLDDERCRVLLKKKCEENPEKEYCVVKEVRSESEEAEQEKPRMVTTVIGIAKPYQVSAPCKECKTNCLKTCKEEYETRREIGLCVAECVKEKCRGCVVEQLKRVARAKASEIVKKVLEKDFCKRCLAVCLHNAGERVRNAIKEAVEKRISEARKILPWKKRLSSVKGIVPSIVKKIVKSEESNESSNGTTSEESKKAANEKQHGKK
ncbi:MAG: hypothetical protein J7L14_00475 [Candidatus Diapherotrites archaeon]|nr:hypothetical protein [Candidatus Diapherotrites archaeon]